MANARVEHTRGCTGHARVKSRIGGYSYICLRCGAESDLIKAPKGTSFPDKRFKLRGDMEAYMRKRKQELSGRLANETEKRLLDLLEDLVGNTDEESFADFLVDKRGFTVDESNALLSLLEKAVKGVRG